MKKQLIRYFLEFLVIVLGISISFYLEKQNAIKYKEMLKNQSLNRILNNCEIDGEDYKFNLTAQKIAVKSGKWLVNNQHKLSTFSRDSLGYHLGAAISINTTFIDNQEEYRGLQNSGLIELIENEYVVTAIQNKYIYHDFCKQLETMINKQADNLLDHLYTNTKYKSDKINKLGYHIDRTYTGDFKISQKILQQIQDKQFLHEYYIGRILRGIKTDDHLIKLINTEIGL
tara:strand:- start:2948 stop:3634 length:687 start_codon:yes stop_codon:yes gene_type:complete